MKKRKAWFCQDCRVMMHYDPKRDFYKCPECGVEVWPETKADQGEIASLMREKYQANLPAKDPIPAGEPAPGGGGSKNKGRSRKGDMQKKTLAQINSGLNGKCAAFNS